MKIDRNPDEIQAMDAFHSGDYEAGHALQDGFLAELHKAMREDGLDHCSCKADCKHHGHCLDCVALHRGHQDHLPACFHGMVNDRLRRLSLLTEDSMSKGLE